MKRCEILEAQEWKFEKMKSSTYEQQMQRHVVAVFLI